MNKPVKPNITIPESFAKNGIKTDFDSDLITEGFDSLKPDVLAGDNLNKFIDDTYKGLNYGMAAADAINLINEGETLTVVDGKLTSGATGGGLEVCDIGMALYVDETKGLRRYLNGQIVDINTNTQLFLNRLLKIKTTNPDYFTTESNWQAEKTMNIDGCVYKFVLNYDSTGTNVISVRLPKYPDYVELNNNSINNTAPVAVYGNGRGLGLVDSVNSPTYRTLIDYSYPNNIEGLVPGNLTFDHNTVFPVGTNTSNQSGYIRNVFWGVSQNANTSGLTGTATITSNFKQTKLKLYYFIQVATGQETENNIVNDIELNNPYSFGKSEYSKTPKDNLSWLASKGQWNPKGTYPSYYDWILENVNKGVEDFKLSTDTYDDYSWVINTTEETFRLPLLDGSEDLPSNRYTDLKLKASESTYTASANGWFTFRFNTTQAGTWMYAEILGTKLTKQQSAYAAGYQIGTTLPVKKGQILYLAYTNINTTPLVFRFVYAQGNGTLYYYVGETVQNANLIDAGRIGEQLADKVDLDLANLSSEGKEAMTAYWITSGSPSINIPINLTISTTPQYWEAPSNGYVWFYMVSASSGAYGYIGVKEEYRDLWSITDIYRGWLYINKGQHLSVRTDVGTITLGEVHFIAKQ